MRPYTEDGKTPKKRQHTKRGQKAINGVKKSLTKAKVTAVKTKRKIQIGGGENGEEIEDLLEQTTNGQPGTPVAKKVIETTSKTSTAAKQMKKLKSLVQVAANGGSNSSPSRRSARISQRNREISNVSMAEEASEIKNEVNGTTSSSKSGGGLLQRTISKIWRFPEGITGVSYNDIESPTAKKPEEAEVDKPDKTTANGSCVIS